MIYVILDHGILRAASVISMIPSPQILSTTSPFEHRRYTLLQRILSEDIHSVVVFSGLESLYQTCCILKYMTFKMIARGDRKSTFCKCICDYATTRLSPHFISVIYLSLSYKHWREIRVSTNLWVASQDMASNPNEFLWGCYLADAVSIVADLPYTLC